MPPIGLEPRYLVMLERAFAESLDDQQVFVYLFGSRAVGSWRPGSDVDLAFEGEGDLKTPIAKLAAKLEDSTFPYKVDCVDLAHVDKRFLQSIRSQRVKLWPK